jgi:hypothetical protein
MKQCRKCGEEKDVSLFYKRSRAKDGYNPHCKSCVQKYESEYRTSDMQRKYNLKKSFNLSIDEYNVMYAKQNGVCAICNQVETTVRLGKVQNLSVDHCHTTGKIRGLLCNSCNRALGKFKDDVVILRNAVSYLEKYSD